ncbi:hypothetical protein ABB37_03479 [Leptomonas pyrrhocoris]|uniref:Uncharacterized protein n=1 Tax=Leptomonas pyrrhocoris TaxID=157538 RepID=A0A0M9G511_LEPPY|nr:hypothetical protein ABB37_03479 [Leptomonas pyrrhocoris]KPA82403.1 hypothetical protein ABB37_03479 [Leptomonas pyrrhocoris]|eukprot:XP_015660842.1 hypothetical protein ABB37_03479 [Leptomonas pyrrhocoris]
MSNLSTSTTRVFFVGGLPYSVDENVSTAAIESLSFIELPRLPISSSGTTSEGGAGDARPLVSPVLHLGRQSPLLRNSLKNDRRWSRKLLEVTTWCIHGLPTGDKVYPIDAAALPFAGVRVRLCGTGGAVRVIPRRSSEQRCVTALSVVGAWAWLQHGDALDFEGGLQLRFLAVHVRAGPVSALAQKASFVWVRPNVAAGSATPVAMWASRYSNWSAVPVFLKAKMLMEAAVLVQQATLREKAQMQESVTGTGAPSPIASERALPLPRCEGTDARDERAGSPLRAPPSLEDAVNLSRGGDIHHNSLLRRYSNSSEARQDACMAADEADEEAATPTSESQQRQRQRPLSLYAAPNSPPVFHDREQTRSAPDVVGAVFGGRMAVQRPQSASPSRSSPPRHAAGLGLQQRLTGPSMGTRGNVLRYSFATFSESMDDKLLEALQNLENGGTEVGDVLVQRQQREPAVLLGAMEDELSGPRSTSAEQVASHLRTTLPTRGHGQEGRGRSGAPQRSRRTTKQGSRGKTADDSGVHGRRSGSRKSAGGDVGGELMSSLSQPLRREGEGDDAVTVPLLTRADIKRLPVNQYAEEDSQVVFFDH